MLCPYIINLPLKKIANKLRNNSTSAESVLWTYLKNKQLDGRKFRRQHSAGNYILDFYCPSENLAVELDGEDHFWDEGIRRDEKHTVYLSSLNIRVIRFENKWVFEDIEYVLHLMKNVYHPLIPS